MSDIDTPPPAAAHAMPLQTYKLERRDPPRGSAPLSFRVATIGAALMEALGTICPIVEYDLDWEDSHLLISTANDDAWALTPCDLITELSTVDGWSGELIGAYLAEAYKEHGFEGIDTSSREEFAQWLAARANAALASSRSRSDAGDLVGATLKTPAGDVVHVEELDDRVLGVPWLRCRVIESPGRDLGPAGELIGVDPERAREWTRIEPTAPRAGYEVGNRVTNDGKAYVCTATDQPPAAAGADSGRDSRAALVRDGLALPAADDAQFRASMQRRFGMANTEALTRSGSAVGGLFRAGEPPPDPDTVDLVMELENQVAAATARADAAEADARLGRGIIGAMRSFRAAACEVAIRDALGEYMAPEHLDPDGERADSLVAAILKKLEGNAEFTPTAGREPGPAELEDKFAAAASNLELAHREIERIRPRMERFEQRAKELRDQLDAIGEAIEKHLSNDEHSNLERVARAGAERDAAARAAAAIVTEHLGVKLVDQPGPIGENLTRIEHGLIALKRRAEKAEAANERLRRERDRAREKSPSTGPTPSAMPRVKLTRAGGYDPATGLEKPARRSASVAVDVAVGARRTKHPGGKPTRRTTRRKGTR